MSTTTGTQNNTSTSACGRKLSAQHAAHLVVKTVDGFLGVVRTKKADETAAFGLAGSICGERVGEMLPLPC